jgi:hypothetical protein
MSWWNDIIGLDWGVDPTTKNPAEAYANYTQHLKDMVEKKGWPSRMVERMSAQAKIVEAESPTAQAFWLAVADQEPAWITEAGVEPGSLPKINSHIQYLQSKGAASTAWEQAQIEFSMSNVGQAIASETGKDLKDKVDPTKSIWPWLIGGVVALVLIKR